MNPFGASMLHITEMGSSSVLLSLALSPFKQFTDQDYTLQVTEPPQPKLPISALGSMLARNRPFHANCQLMAGVLNGVKTD